MQINVLFLQSQWKKIAIYIILFLLILLLLCSQLQNKNIGGLILLNGNRSAVSSIWPTPKIQTEEIADSGQFNFHFEDALKNPCWYEQPSNNRSSTSPEGKLRCFPYFFLAGFPKCGTTDLMNRIMAHPDVVAAETKEQHWWSVRKFTGFRGEGKRDLEWYLDQFKNITEILQKNCQKSEISANISSICSRLVTGDGSPSTIWRSQNLFQFLKKAKTKKEARNLWNTYSQRRINGSFLKFNQTFDSNNRGSGPKLLEVPFTNADAIHSYLPSTKIIVLLRNPTERLYSEFIYFTRNSSSNSVRNYVQRRFGFLSLTSIRRMKSCSSRLPLRICAYAVQQSSVRLELGLYMFFIKDWLAVFPRDQILFIRTEDYKRDVQGTLERVYKHLGLEPLDDDTMRRTLAAPLLNVRNNKAIGPMDNRTRRSLNDFYRQFNVELADLLGDDAFLWEDMP